MMIFAKDLWRALDGLPETMAFRDPYCVVHIIERAPVNFGEPVSNQGGIVHRITFKRLGTEWVTDDLIIDNR